MEWISESTLADEIGENVILNVKLAQRKKLGEDELSATVNLFVFIFSN